MSTAFIFARGGSKGVKDKNIREVAGIPLIGRAIRGALTSRSIQKVVVSTDSEKIAAVAQSHGAEILMRPEALATDTASELLAWKHAVESKPQFFEDKNSLFVSLPATSPLRASEDIDNAIERYREGNCDIVLGICPSDRNPYLNMVTVDEKGLIKLAIEGASAYRRQDVPAVFSITTVVYVSSPKYILQCTSLMEGKVGHIVIPTERSLDIDTEFDLHLADILLRHPFGANRS